VYNAMPYLHESIRSVFGQTYGGFELVIRDDGSTDGSRDVLRAWAARDERIRLFEGTERLGPAGNSNWVVQQATGSLVARMDADDVSHPDRLRRQVETFISAPDVDLVGTLWVGIDRNGRVVRPRDCWRLARRSPFAPFAHGSIMVRTDALRRVAYREACDYWEDLDLYLRLGRRGQLAVLPEPLYCYRHTETSARLVGRREQVEAAVDLMYRCVARYQRGASYEPLLFSRVESPQHRVSAKAVVSVACLQLWAGERPAVLRRAWRGTTPKLAIRSLPSLVWAAWARLHPATLRLSMRAVLRVRNALLWRGIRDGHVYAWSPGEGSHLLQPAPSLRRTASQSLSGVGARHTS